MIKSRLFSQSRHASFGYPGDTITQALNSFFEANPTARPLLGIPYQEQVILLYDDGVEAEAQEVPAKEVSGQEAQTPMEEISSSVRNAIREAAPRVSEAFLEFESQTRRAIHELFRALERAAKGDDNPPDRN